MAKDIIKLGDVATYINGYAFKPEDRGEEGLQIIRIQDLTGNSYDLGFYNGKYPKKIEINDGDVLISWSASLGVYVWNGGKALLNQHIFKVKFDKVDIDKSYFVYAVRYKLNDMGKKTHGATMKHIVKRDFDATEIPYPPLKKQIEIAINLDKVLMVIKERKRELKLLDELIKARFVELFECGDHEIVKASDVCDFITKGTTPPTGEITEEYENGKIPFLKVYNLSFTGEMLFDENPQYILAETHNGKLARSKVYPNDVLMNIVGPPLGKFTLVTDEFEEWNINQAIAIFRAKERILPRFLLHALMQPKVLEPFIGQAVGIRQQNLSLEQCRNLQFPLPSLEEQKSFVEFAEQLDKSKVAVQKALDETQILFDSLMQKYFG
ncbi:restriction endonuclease subunit S [Agathobacter rectalis]|uniref:Restriction endonuclease subunit S n=1 Tax=Agathobacter rectalis TaxID=39491 RepID=A0A413BJ38_9FIRM|nr:restriction endonuclease subunit S [Agathobacter rectalis]